MPGSMSVPTSSSRFWSLSCLIRCLVLQRRLAPGGLKLYRPGRHVEEKQRGEPITPTRTLFQMLMHFSGLIRDSS